LAAGEIIPVAYPTEVSPPSPSQVDGAFLVKPAPEIGDYRILVGAFSLTFLLQFRKSLP
jgi:hypothetical protein